MPDPSSDSPLLQAANRSLVLSIDLIGWELTHPGDRLELALKEPGVHWKIKNLIDKEAGYLVNPSFGANFGATGEQAKKIAFGTLGVLGEASWDSIKKSPRYKLLDSSLKDFKTEFDKTPTGIFVDRHKMELILAGSLLTIGGAVAQYHFRTNDDFADLYAKGVSLATKKIKIGDLTLGAEFPKFVPSKRQVEFKALAGYDFKVVDTKFEFGGKFENDRMNQFDGKAVVQVPLHAAALDLKLKGSLGASTVRNPLTDVFDTKLKYSLGVEAETKDKNFMLDVMLSNEDKNYLLTGGLKYRF